jgi:alkylhydroperoxidase family enzyme
MAPASRASMRRAPLPEPLGSTLTRPFGIDDAQGMSGRDVAANRLERLRAEASRLVDAVLDGAGASSPTARRAAFAGRAADPAVARYLDVVRRHAYRVTDEDVERLRAAGLDDDAIFELTVATAVGAGMERLRAGLLLLGREA